MLAHLSVRAPLSLVLKKVFAKKVVDGLHILVKPFILNSRTEFNTLGWLHGGDYKLISLDDQPQHFI